MRIVVKNEFPLILFLSGILALLIILNVSGNVRVVLGLPFVLFFPGYTLIAALFPAGDELNGIERVALSFGLSIVMVPPLGLILNYTPWGIRLYPILMTLLVCIILLSIIAIYRRKKISFEKRFIVPLNIEIAKWGHLAGQSKIISVVLVGAVVFAAGSLYYVATTPKVSDGFTEFYILDSGGKAEEYPRDMRAGEDNEVILGTVNHENRPVCYMAEVRMNGAVRTQLGPFTLNHEEKKEEPVRFRADASHENQKVEFLLFKDGESEPYRSLHLWVNIYE